MLELILNGQKINEEAELSLTELLEKHRFTIGEVAVAVNCEFVPRSKYSEFRLQSGQQIEILEPMQGG